MKELIKNFALSNKVFALILKENNLVDKKDKLLEVSSPLCIASTFNLRGFSTYVSIEPDHKFYNNFLLNDGKKTNFIYSGEICEEVRSVVRKIANTSSFNIGICSNNPTEFALQKDSYSRFKSELESSYGIEIEEIDKRLDDYEAYVLSYKRK